MHTASFEASLPNECWQSDVTHWQLADGVEVEICNVLDDYSRVLIASRVFAITTARGVLGVFRRAAKIWGYPASILTDIHSESTPCLPLVKRPVS